MTTFNDKPPEITKQEWMDKLENVHLQRTDMNRLVMNYLVTGKFIFLWWLFLFLLYTTFWFFFSRGFQGSCWEVCFRSRVQSPWRAGTVGWAHQDPWLHPGRKNPGSHRSRQPASSRPAWLGPLPLFSPAAATPHWTDPAQEHWRGIAICSGTYLPIYLLHYRIFRIS